MQPRRAARPPRGPEAPGDPRGAGGLWRGGRARPPRGPRPRAPPFPQPSPGPARAGRAARRAQSAAGTPAVAACGRPRGLPVPPGPRRPSAGPTHPFILRPRPGVGRRIPGLTSERRWQWTRKLGWYCSPPGLQRESFPAEREG
ncbi:proline-rich protein 2-like [Onychomys torridus]|uniref:proline-rich protein 2-like n=1 Tax=Onychomys torridus TaxID=38674 RepID=UPI00167F2F2A|nr:proline-rich protein 2-like [Onychomys torridus]